MGVKIESVYKLEPSCMDFIWGGTKLISWGKKINSDVLAEAWELSYRNDYCSLIASGINKGKRLIDVLPKEELGSNVTKFEFFPMLVKLLDPSKDLSVQVHPNDAYALKHENCYGKTEMWYVVEAKEDAGFYVGFKNDVTKEEIVQRIKDNSLTEAMNFVTVKPGDCYMVPSGTVHTICKDVIILEVQQNSTITYRLYDYGRLGKDGKPRELHVDKALDVLNLNKYEKPEFKGDLLGKCKYFSSYKYDFDGEMEIFTDLKSFKTFTIVDGNGSVEGIPFKKGDTFIMPINKKCVVKGKGRLVLSLVE